MNAYEQMREALEKIRDLLFLRGDGKVRCTLTWDEFNDSWLTCKNALTAKPRNCDVWTAEEQAERFHKFCTKHRCAIAGMCDPNCPCGGSQDECLCLCKWGQMPYEENGAE